MGYTVSFIVEIVDAKTPNANVLANLGWVQVICPEAGTVTPSFRYYDITFLNPALHQLTTNRWIKNGEVFANGLASDYPNAVALNNLRAFSGVDINSLPWFDMSNWRTGTGNYYYRIRNKSGCYAVRREKINYGSNSAVASKLDYYFADGTSFAYPGYLNDSGSMGPYTDYAELTALCNIPIVVLNTDGTISSVKSAFNIKASRLGIGGSTYEMGIEPLSGTNATKLKNWWNACVFAEPDDPFSQGGNSTGGTGGHGTFSDSGDTISIPNLPALSAVSTGFISLFSPSLSELNALAAYMWGPLDLDNWKKIFADPIEAILGLSIVPVAVPTSGAVPVAVGNISTNVNMSKASSQYVQVDCGSLTINEFWGAYLDYEPYTDFSIYLPYCGIHPVKADDIMGKTVHVVYNVDILSGACCAFIAVNGTVLYSFMGQCSSSIPISGTSFTQMINGIISAATSIGSMVATGGASAPVAVPSLVNTAVNDMKPQIEKSGSLSGGGGMLAVQTPYLIVSRPRQAHPDRQASFTGYPSFVTRKISDLKGYTEVEQIHMENLSTTSDEVAELENLLKSGVIFPF